MTAPSADRHAPSPTPGASEEYDALRTSAGLVDYAGAGLLRVSGPRAAAYLGTVATRGTDFLLQGQILNTLTLRPDGTVVAELAIHHTGDDYLVEIWPAQRAEAVSHLVHAAAAWDGVQVHDVSDDYRVFGVEGPASFRVVRPYVPFDIAAMSYRSFTSTEWNGAPLLVTRSGVTGEYGYKLIVAAESGPALYAELEQSDAHPCGIAAVDVCRMEMRFANLERESGGAPVTPFALGLQWMVDFQREFTGAEALRELHETGHDRLPVCWTADAGLDRAPEHASPLLIEGTEVGHVRHSEWSPTLERFIGTAEVSDEFAASGLSYALGGTTHSVRTISAPYMVPTSFGVAMD